MSYEETGIHAESSHPFSVDHNVLDDDQALGSSSCATCHGPGLSFPPGDASEVFDRKILVDPFGVDGNAIYETVSELTGIGEREEEGPSFIRGDGNADGGVNIADASFLLNFLFASGVAIPCHAAGDANGDGSVNITDAISVLNFLFVSGPPPVAPYPQCGPGELESDADLGCVSPPPTCVDSD